MKRIILIAALLSFTVQFSCTTQATSIERASEVQETTVARNVGATDFSRLISEKQSAIILDVRTPGEVAQGYIDGALNLDISSSRFKSDIDKLDKTKPVLIYCRSGRRSASAMRYMRDLGFSEVYNLTGGIIAWNQAGLKTVK